MNVYEIYSPFWKLCDLERRSTDQGVCSHHTESDALPIRTNTCLNLPQLQFSSASIVACANCQKL